MEIKATSLNAKLPLQLVGGIYGIYSSDLFTIPTSSSALITTDLVLKLNAGCHNLGMIVPTKELTQSGIHVQSSMLLPGEEVDLKISVYNSKTSENFVIHKYEKVAHLVIFQAHEVDVKVCNYGSDTFKRVKCL